MAKIGDVIDGKYQILSLIGEGGMSRVWLARDTRLLKTWAVKEVGRTAKDANNEVVVQSLMAEAELMKKLDHPALPRIVDIIEDGKTIYVVMDLVEGESLKDVLNGRQRPFGQEDVIEWGIQLCDVLEYLHTRTPPVIYRDMKPSNVMLREDGTVKLIDFGIAREYKEGKGEDTKMLGTHGYAAPEQLTKNIQSDARTDVYSLGVTLHHLVTGRGPLQDTVIRPIRQINPQLSEGLEHIISKAVQQDPAKRYQSCAEMSYDLQHYEKLTEGYRSVQKAKLKRFNRLCAGAAASLLLGGVCLGASFYFKNTTFDSYMQQAQAASVEESGDEPSAAERYYEQAIEVDPAKMEPYQSIVNDVYRADRNFTMAETSRWAALYSKHIDDIKGSDQYAKLCYDVGNLFFVYFEQSGDVTGADDSRTYAMSAGVQAAQWFQYAIDDYDKRQEGGQPCSMTAEERTAAATYVTIGQFYQKLSQQTLEGNEGSVYEGYWDALESALGNLSDNDAVMVKLRLYELAYEAVESPTYLNGFRRVGVDRMQAEDMLQNVVDGASKLEQDAASSEKALSMYQHIVANVGKGTGEAALANTAAWKNIENVYGNAAAASRSSEQDPTGSNGESGVA